MVQHYRLSMDIVPYNVNQARLTYFHGDSQYASKLKTKNVNNIVNNNCWAFPENMNPIMQPKQGYFLLKHDYNSKTFISLFIFSFHDEEHKKRRCQLYQILVVKLFKYQNK
jgi:hypothetical protein